MVLIAETLFTCSNDLLTDQLFAALSALGESQLQSFRSLCWISFYSDQVEFNAEGGTLSLSLWTSGLHFKFQIEATYEYVPAVYDHMCCVQYVLVRHARTHTKHTYIYKSWTFGNNSFENRPIHHPSHGIASFHSALIG